MVFIKHFSHRCLYSDACTRAAALEGALIEDGVSCESYFACAEIDKWAPPADIQKLEAALTAAGTRHRIEWYPKVEHGFVFPLRGTIYNQPAAERHWERLFSLFGRTLR